MHKLEELRSARESVASASRALGSLYIHELYSVRINTPYYLLSKSGIGESTQSLRDSLDSLWHKLDVLIAAECEEVCDD